MEEESTAAPLGGLPEPDPQEATIEAQNASRVARRRQAAALFTDISRVSGEDLSRGGDTRRVGGRFEELQEVPERQTPPGLGLTSSDLRGLIQSLTIQPRQEVLGTNAFLSSFGPNVLGINRI